MSYGSLKWQGWILPEEQSLPLLEHAYKCGINTWDTADVYSNGVSEQIIGKAIKQYSIPRAQLVILSKCYFGVDPAEQPGIASVSTNDGSRWVNNVGLSRKHIFDAVDASVERLGTYIDVLQIHRLDRETPMEEIMRALNDVVESGKVRYIGASSMAAWEFQMLQNIAEKNGWHKFISMQSEFLATTTLPPVFVSSEHFRCGITIDAENWFTRADKRPQITTTSSTAKKSGR